MYITQYIYMYVMYIHAYMTKGAQQRETVTFLRSRIYFQLMPLSSRCHWDLANVIFLVYDIYRLDGYLIKTVEQDWAYIRSCYYITSSQ